MASTAADGSSRLLSRTEPAWRWALTYAATTAVILLPAIWNRFPFIFADTGGYFIRPIEHDLALGRSALYGAFLFAGMAADFWPSIIVQALLCAFTVGLVLRVQGWERPAILAAVMVALCVGTSLPWYADQLMPDVFVPLSVLALYLMAFAGPQLRSWEIAALAATLAFAIASHMAIFAIMLILFACFAGLRLVAAADCWLRPRLRLPAASIAAGATLALFSNYLIAGVAGFTPGGPTFLFARMLQDGLVKAYLDRNCPDPTLALCRYRDSLPSRADDWLWDVGPLDQLGGWQGFAPEARRIIIGSIMQQPLANLRAVVAGTSAQLVAVATGDGFDATKNWYTEWTIQTYVPQAAERFFAAAQQHNAIDFRVINAVQVPLAVGATFVLPVLVILGWRRRALTAALGLTVFVALLANAAICAMFSGVNDRYQSRIVSIAVLAAALAGYELLQSRRRSAAISAAAVSPSPDQAAPRGS
jgi:hypothetical protein